MKIKKHALAVGLVGGLATAVAATPTLELAPKAQIGYMLSSKFTDDTTQLAAGTAAGSVLGALGGMKVGLTIGTAVAGPVGAIAGGVAGAL